jgi:hypothetical protein
MMKQPHLTPKKVAKFILTMEAEPDQDLAYKLVNGLLLEIPTTMDERINACLAKLGAQTRIQRNPGGETDDSRRV